jgi:lipopolysaccharide export LptBFGC system permease protein LptF
MATLLHRYIARRFLSPFLTGMGVFTALLLMDQLSRSVDQISTQAGDLASLAWSFVLLTVPLLSWSMPMAFLLGTLASLEQMKEDRETTALFAAGVSPLSFLPPYLGMAALCCAGALAVNLHLAPAALHAYADRLTAAARAQFFADLTPGLFFKGIPDTVLLVGGADRDTGEIKGVMLVKDKVGEQDQVILARDGMLSFPRTGEPRIDLALFRGALHPVSAPGVSYFSGAFSSLTTALRGAETSAASALPRNQVMLAATGGELAERLRRAELEGDQQQVRATRVEQGKRFTSPLSILLYPFLVIPLALMTGRLGRGAAFAASVALFIGQFALFFVAATMAESGALAASIAPFLPPAVLAAGALYVFLPFAWRSGWGR